MFMLQSCLLVVKLEVVVDFGCQLAFDVLQSGDFESELLDLALALEDLRFLSLGQVL